jgi:hypothetical protein
MAQATDSNTTRRTVLAGATALATIPEAIMPTKANAADDPMLAAIDNVKRAEAALEPATKRVSVVETRYESKARGGWYVFMHGNYPPEDREGPADWVAAQLELGAVRAAYNNAKLVLLTTKPTTVEGVAAALEFDCQIEFGEEDKIGEPYLKAWHDGGDEELAEAAHQFPELLAGQLRAIAANA